MRTAAQVWTLAVVGPQVWLYTDTKGSLFWDITVWNLLGRQHEINAKIVAELLSRTQLFCEPMDCSPPGSSVHGILQGTTLEWVAVPFSRGSSWPRDWTPVSCLVGGFFTPEPPGKPTEIVSHEWSHTWVQQCDFVEEALVGLCDFLQLISAANLSSRSHSVRGWENECWVDSSLKNGHAEGGRKPGW